MIRNLFLPWDALIEEIPELQLVDWDDDYINHLTEFRVLDMCVDPISKQKKYRVTTVRVAVGVEIEKGGNL